MAKTPRLKFYGITLNLLEVRRLAFGAGYKSNPADTQPKTPKYNEYTWLPYNGRYLVEGEKFTAEDLPEFYEKGLIRYDRKQRGAVWTKLGARWMMRFARLNDHVRFGHTGKYDWMKYRKQFKTREKQWLTRHQ